MTRLFFSSAVLAVRISIPPPLAIAQDTRSHSRRGEAEFISSNRQDSIHRERPG